MLGLIKQWFRVWFVRRLAQQAGQEKVRWDETYGMYAESSKYYVEVSHRFEVLKRWLRIHDRRHPDHRTRVR